MNHEQLHKALQLWFQGKITYEILDELDLKIDTFELVAEMSWALKLYPGYKIWSLPRIELRNIYDTLYGSSNIHALAS